MFIQHKVDESRQGTVLQEKEKKQEEFHSVKVIPKNLNIKDNC